MLDLLSHHGTAARTQAAPPLPASGPARFAALFAAKRRDPADVMYLKENGEFLNIVEATRPSDAHDAAAHYVEFHAGAEEFLGFFPQYYRFVLSIVSDLEALGLPEGPGRRIAAKVLRMGLPVGEVSDLHRLEVRRLCARHGLDCLPDDTGLERRARRFMARSAAFAVPNRKAAYDLTHFVFYLTDYVRRTFDAPPGVVTSLLYCGLLSLLDEDVDLLSEVAIALRYLGRTPPRYWEKYIESELSDFRVHAADLAAVSSQTDDYHAFLVANWHQATVGNPSLFHRFRPGPVAFFRRQKKQSALIEISGLLLSLTQKRRESGLALLARV